MANKKIIYFVAGGLVFFLAVFMFWQFGFVGQIKKRNALRQEEKKFNNAVQKMDVLEPGEISKAIPDLEKIIQSPTSPEKEANAKILLALAYANTGNPVKAVEILKEAALNSKYSNFSRAKALEGLIKEAGIRGKNFSVSYIFSDEQFKSFYKEEDFALALRKMAEWSDELYPLPIPNYQIAFWYAERLIQDKYFPYLTQEKRGEYGLALDQRFGKAQELFSQAKEGGMDENRLMQGHLYQGQIALRIFLLDAADSKITTGEDDFLKAAAIARRTYIPHNLGFETIFHAAGFLAEVYGSSKLGDIQAFLSPIISLPNTASNSRFLVFLREEKDSYHDKHYHKREILLLAKIDPEFRNLLKQLGWSDGDLSKNIISFAESKH